jgi:anti-anti-sigma factor
VGGLPLLDRVALGDHVCWAVDDDTVRSEAIAGFVRAGLQARQKVIYCGDDPDGVLASLRRHGVGIRAPLATGQLSAYPAQDCYLTGGRFDPAAALVRWRAVIDGAQAEGYPGIRVLGDMAWASRDGGPTAALQWYEAQVNTIVLDGYVAGVCAYDPRLFDPLELRRLSWTHPAAAGPVAAFDPATALRVQRTREPSGLRLTGEVDLSNRLALKVVVGHLFDDGPAEVTVDVGGLTFADTAAVRLLVAAAAAGPGRMRLTGCSPALLRLLDFHRAGRVPGLAVVGR